MGDIVERTEHVVHGHEGGRHAGGRGQELAPVHAMVAAQVVSEFLDARLDLRRNGGGK